MQTDFANLQPQKKRAWGHEAYKEFRENFFWDKFLGKGDTAVVERITEITKTDKGTSSAMLRLVGDLAGGGITGDNQLEGRESELKSYWQEVNIGRVRKGVRNKGILSEQKSVIEFRREGKDKLGRWMGELMDDLMFLTASGISYAYNTDGSTRDTPVGEDPLTTLDFANDVAPPSANRHFNWNGSALVAGDTTSIANTFTVNYKLIIDAMVEAMTRRIKPIKIGGKDYFIFLIHPRTYGALMKDADFRNSIIHGMDRGKDNPVFTGATITYHGAIIHQHNKVFNTMGAASGSKWGSGGTVNGTRSLLVGAQAMALADLETPQWNEEEFDYGNQQGIAISKIFGILKPRFYTRWDKSTEDFGVMAINHYIA